jgi:hypothetical protein
MLGTKPLGERFAAFVIRAYLDIRASSFVIAGALGYPKVQSTKGPRRAKGEAEPFRSHLPKRKHVSVLVRDL